jgi:alanyl-tRNA synthetase
MGILETTLKTLAAGGMFDGELAFKLHDTYGFPLDLTADICREANVNVDTAAFDAAMARQKNQARAAGKFKLGAGLEYAGAATTFHGYDTLTRDATVLALYKDGAAVNELKEGELGVVVLDHTPFYAESGGQVGDRGLLQSTHGVFEVEDTLKIQAQVFGHHGVVKTGSLTIGDAVLARVDEDARARTMRNHSVTHLMHKALREVLGEHVQQKGSLVDAEKTRFDFVQPNPMTAAQIREVEARVNVEILANTATQARVMPIDEAQKTGAMMLFGEKYGDEVRVLDIGSSRELCGGTHVDAHRRHRRVQDPAGNRRRRRHPPRRGDHRHRCAGLYRRNRKESRRDCAARQGPASRGCRARGAIDGTEPRAGKGTRPAEVQAGSQRRR